MPLFASLVASLGGALVSLFSRFLGIQAALRLASYVTYIAITAAFVASVYVCVGGLLSMVQSLSGGAPSASNWVGYFFMGLGMFVPANAGGVMSCVGSVWLACNVYRLQQVGTIHFA